MSTTTYTATYTRTHTATYLADVVMGTFTDVVAHLALDPRGLWNRAQDEAALIRWMVEGSLRSVVLECHQPSGRVSPIIEIEVEYRAGGEGDVAFVAHRAAMARFRAKLETVPRGTAVRIVATFRSTPTSMPGWTSGRRAAVSGMHSFTFGTIGSGPHARATMRYFTGS
jgi:hypothetical protein